MASQQVEKKIYDIIIIGAGISGLTAAYELIRAHPRLNLLVLEAKDRVGGRTLTVAIDVGNKRKEKFDLGGQWVTSSQLDICEMLSELDLHTYRQYRQGKKIMQLGTGQPRTYSSDFPSQGEDHSSDLSELTAFIQKMEKMCKTVSMEDPFKSPLASTFDGVTMETFARENMRSQTSIDCIQTACRGFTGADMSRISVLFFLAYANSTGGVMKMLLSSKGCGQEMRVKGGTQQISEKLADRIGRHKIRLGEPVAKISQNSSKTTITTLNGNTFSCKRVIVSAPPPCVAKMEFEPPLAEMRQQLLESMPVGHLTKFIITYDKAYWRDAGYSGEILSNGGPTKTPGCSSGPLNDLYDGTTENGVPALVGFIAGKPGVEWHAKTAEERKSAILKDLAAFYGGWILQPTSYTEKIWADEKYNGGCPVSYVVPGAMHGFHTLRKPHGRIWWCGTETATSWNGYMNGAVQTGRRVAVEVMVDSNLEVPELLQKRVERKPNVENYTGPRAKL